jgi:peptide/nickel transport system substrate-binding protein
MPSPTLRYLRYTVVLLAGVLLVSCGSQPTQAPQAPTDTLAPTMSQNPTPTFTPPPPPPRVLSICMGQEPESLFLYGDSSLAARGVRQAIYDGPFDMLVFQLHPVILERVPSLENGAVAIESTAVGKGAMFVDPEGKLVTLDEGVSYYPPDCREAECAQSYTGEEPVEMDQMVVHFDLRPDVLWSDGVPVTAGDSAYSFQVADDLYPRARAELLDHTESYQALDDTVVEWRGLPGYRASNYATFFFTPLPQHAWSSISALDLLTQEVSARYPLGWGPYMIDDWTRGDHISLVKNPSYFRAQEGLPAFDRLVYRFVPNREEALNALLAGECDLLDETVPLESLSENLMALHDEGRIDFAYVSGSTWEHIDFGIRPYGEDAISLFQSREARQAVAMCIDRQAILDGLPLDRGPVLDDYVPPLHPLDNPDVRQYPYDPQEGAQLLNSLGWIDLDGDPATPRVAQGVPGVPDGTRFEVTLLALAQGDGERSAEIVQNSLAACGILVKVDLKDWQELFQSGPEGPIFGRHFDMAEFAWMGSIEPPCFLYTTQEIPGPYPEYSRGWGGANAAGYSNTEYDQACTIALSTLPDFDGYRQAHYQAQRIFSEDLPALPLYSHLRITATRPDFCGMNLDPSMESVMWNIETFNYGSECDR